MLLPRQAEGSKKRRPDSIIQSCVDTCVFPTSNGRTHKKEREIKKKRAYYVGRYIYVLTKFGFFFLVMMDLE